MFESPTMARWSTDRRPGGWTAADAGVAAVFLVLLVTEVAFDRDMTPRGPLLLGCIVIAGSLAWRRTHPAVVAVVVCSGNAAVSALANGEYPPQLAILPVLIAIYTASLLTSDGLAIGTASVTAVLVAVAHIVTEVGDSGDFWPWMLWGGAWAAGTFVRRRTELAARHAARAALLEIEARTAAARSAEAERDRIAREMHDVVAHAVSVMVVQAGAERLRLGAQAGPTGDALTAIEESGRTALTELRGMLGVLRDGTDEVLAPLPGLAALPALIERVREAGLPVELTCRPVDALASEATGSSVALAGYRIVQEALTNVMRHQGLVPTRVEVELTGKRLLLTVASRSCSNARMPPQSNDGRGLVGMRERVRTLGGSFDASFQNGKFLVTADLPLRSGAVA